MTGKNKCRLTEGIRQKWQGRVQTKTNAFSERLDVLKPIRIRTLVLTTGMRRIWEWKHIDWKSGVIDAQQSVAISLKGEIHVQEP